MAYWLIKSEPDAYGWDRLVAEGETVWDGVRNHRAANNLRAMKKGDHVFYYHSVSSKEIVGIVEVTKAGIADPSDPDRKWAAVVVRPVRALERPVTLAEIKKEPDLEGIELVRLSRLSVAEIRPQEWQKICAMAQA